MPLFERYIGIDYSGAETPTKSLPGVRLYAATREQMPIEILPPPSRRKYWSRRGLAEWLVAQLGSGPPTLVGIDHGFSFPVRYFQEHRLVGNWRAFLHDFQLHWPTDEDHVFVDFIRDGVCGRGADRTGHSRWRRLAEERCGAKSVFHFDVQGSVAKSTHAGLPWLRFLHENLGARVHFWPFDGWEPPAGRSVIAEIYPALWSRTFPVQGRNPHQHDAYSVARWMLESDASGSLWDSFVPRLTSDERKRASVEGWILGLD